MNCNIVKDLLPLYIDGCCSEESKKCVEEHIKACDKCKKVLEDMNTPCDGVSVSQAPIALNKVGFTVPFVCIDYNRSCIRGKNAVRSGERILGVESYRSRNRIYAFFGELVFCQGLQKQKKLFKLLFDCYTRNNDLCLCMVGIPLRNESF